VATIIVGKLTIYGDLVENVVQEDNDIRDSDEVVIRSAFRQGDRGQGEVQEEEQIDYDVVNDHLLSIMQRLFSTERVTRSGCSSCVDQ
jgi:hypothetical protein